MKALLRFLVLGIVVCVRPSHAQGAEIAVNDHPTHDRIASWLTSGDPRLIAWGAHFAREQNDAAALGLVLEQVEQGTPPEKEDTPESYALFALLDALIERDVSVPPDVIAKIAPTASVQAAILASRHPVAEVTPLLLTWVADRGTPSAQLLSRIAGLLLSHAPPAGFAARVLADEEVTLDISVISPAAGDGLGYGTSGCGDSMRTPADPAWPPIYIYSATDEGAQPSTPVLVEAGGERVNYIRHDLHSGWGACDSPLDNDAAIDHRVLAQMLGVADEELGLKTYAFARIEWTGSDRFALETQRAVQNEEAKFLPFAEELYAKQLIASADLINIRPKLKVIVEDNRTSKDPALPALHFSDPRTVLAPPPPSLEQLLQSAMPPKS